MSDKTKSSSTRRSFLKKSATLSAGVFAGAPAVRRAFASDSPKDRVNVAVVGFHGRGRSHYRAYAGQKNVRVAALCDVDERLFAKAVKDVEDSSGFAPKSEVDFRRLLDDPDIDAVSIATPDHWHALQTIWACQAGKDVYVEKPVSYTIQEGRKMVEAARKYERMVQSGLNKRSNATDRRAMKYLHDGELGEIYRAKVIIFKGRGSIGKAEDSPVPQGVHWDRFLGPAPSRPFNINRFHYGWHFFWDTSTTDIGNSGVHELDVARWGLGKAVHPVEVHSTGGVYVWDSDQETPNLQVATFKYEDGTQLEIELTNLYTPECGGMRSTGNFFYTTKGYMNSANGYETFLGEFIPRSSDSSSGIDERVTNASFPERNYKAGPVISKFSDREETVSQFENFVDCVRSRRREDLYCDIEEGHLSTSLAHLANVSYRTGRKLTFDPKSERFVGDQAANSYLSRDYRHPYVLPEKI
ncbi:MAG: Gfo/Idh/MocA family oxidoreductase [Acidobacteriota bacterium]